MRLLASAILALVLTGCTTCPKQAELKRLKTRLSALKKQYPEVIGGDIVQDIDHIYGMDEIDELENKIAELEGKPLPHPVSKKLSKSERERVLKEMENNARQDNLEEFINSSNKAIEATQ